MARLRPSFTLFSLVTLASVFTFTPATPALAASSQIAEARYAPNALELDVLQSHSGATLTVDGPGDFRSSQFFEPGETVVFLAQDESGGFLPEGSYTYELRLAPDFEPSVRAALREARATGDSAAIEQLRAEGLIPLEATTTYGYLTIADGRIVDPAQPEDGAAGSGLESIHGADEVINDDLVVQGSICAGVDCTNYLRYGADVMRFRQKNMSLHFQDTSTGSNQPSNDWRILINDPSTGGANRFAIEDSDARQVPFTLEAGAPESSLYVNSTGRLGLGTATPIAEIHISSPSSPTVRLQQNFSSPYGPYTWEVTGTNTGFSIRDVDNGNAIPFRIYPGEETGALTLRSDRVGIGTLSPDTRLQVFGTDGGTSLLVEEGASLEQARVMATLKNNGRVLWNMEDTSPDGTIWRFRTVEGQFNFDSDLGAGNEFVLDSGGNLTILGTLTENSNREAKTNIEDVDPQEVLDKVAQLPISTWNYKKAEGISHLGPMAQDFHALFGLGATNTGITTYDTAGVALASIQALHRKVQEQEEEIASLRREKKSLVTQLLQRLEALEQTREPSLSVTPQR